MQISPEKLVQARLARAMSQEEVAIACDLSTRTVQRIEAGHPASLETTKALVSIFGEVVLHISTIDEANWSFPWRLAALQIKRSSRLVASLGFDGLRAFIAVVCVIVAAAKPFFPSQTGLFIHGDVYALGLLRSIPAGAHDVLGYWIVPLMAMGAGGLFMSIGRLRDLGRSIYHAQ